MNDDKEPTVICSNDVQSSHGEMDFSKVHGPFPGDGPHFKTPHVYRRGFCRAQDCLPCSVHEADEEWEKSWGDWNLMNLRLHRCKHCGILWTERVDASPNERSQPDANLRDSV